MQTLEVRKFIDDNQYLFWYTPAPKSETVTDELLVKTVLNYGTMNNVAKIFFDSINKSERRKSNYFELTVNYFTLFFNRYAS